MSVGNSEASHDSLVRTVLKDLFCMCLGVKYVVHIFSRIKNVFCFSSMAETVAFPMYL